MSDRSQVEPEMVASPPSDAVDAKASDTSNESTRPHHPDAFATVHQGLGRRLTVLTFIAVWLASGWYWQARDWNVASRLMLVYAVGDRGTITIDGLDKQTGDLAFKDGHYYSDKAPGYSLLAVPSYWIGKPLFGFESHPLGKNGFAHWPADAWITWCTSGLAAAVIARLILSMLAWMDVPHRWAVMASIGAIWATPMAVYASLAYGHLVSSAFLVFAAGLAIRSDRAVISKSRACAIGLAAGLGVLVELAQAPFAVVIGLVALSRAASFKNLTDMTVMMVLGAIPAAAVLLAYNFVAFGSPLDMGYFYHATKRFAEVHSAENPLGLGRADLSKLKPLLWGEYRGLLFYAPLAALAVPGWGLMLCDKRWAAFWITLAGFVVPLWVNLSYPEWTGGWSTGPRLLVPALPWLAIAAGYACRARLFRYMIVPAIIWGWAVNSLCLSVGGRISQDIAWPLRDAVLPIWFESRIPAIWPGEPFARILPASLLAHSKALKFPQDPQIWAGLLAMLQVIALFCMLRLAGRKRKVESSE